MEIDKNDFTVESEEKPRLVVLKWMEKLLCAIDMSEVEIGLVYNKGNPHGSIWSILITAMGIATLLVFLILTGVLSIQTDTNLATELMGMDDQGNRSYTFGTNDILVNWKKGNAFSIPDVKWQLVDSNYGLIKNLTMKQGIS